MSEYEIGSIDGLYNKQARFKELDRVSFTLDHINQNTIRIARFFVRNKIPLTVLRYLCVLNKEDIL